MLRALRTASRTASSLEMSGLDAPVRTATATPERTKSTLEPGSTWPEAISLSMASEARMTTSKASPACTRLAASTPPTDSMATRVPERRWNASTSSASTKRVAMEEMPLMSVVMSWGNSWG